MNPETVYKVSSAILWVLIVWNIRLCWKSKKLILQQKDAIRYLENMMKSVHWALDRAHKREELLSHMIREEAERKRKDDRNEDEAQGRAAD